MGRDYIRKEQKKAEIEKLLREEMRSTGIPETVLEDALRKLMDSAIRISPPEEESRFMEMIVMNSSARGGGRSTKPGNIRLDLGLLLETIAGGTLTLESINTWWTFPLALLMVLRSLSRNLSVQLTESDAVTIMAMWQAGINNGLIAKLADIKAHADLHAKKYGRNVLSPADILHSITNLVAIGSVTPIKGVADKWKVHEEIRFIYR
ncbi:MULTISPECIES: hypothetical protein [Pseudomonas]|uniref:hypothetical protein n=1 Tax=Pseudomonas sp. P7759 TaxID=2738831 RepID=UPI0015A2BDE4|nr:hypothetical protein [Pseudomonas sp. P7759]NWC73798.1 hypothetical protein [Pseudomonas sp. P7759]